MDGKFKTIISRLKARSQALGDLIDEYYQVVAKADSSYSSPICANQINKQEQIVKPDPIRQAFEQITCPTFGAKLKLDQNIKGEYVNAVLEDHYQTFQEGWEAAVEFLKNKETTEYSDKYSDMVSNGGMDPRK